MKINRSATVNRCTPIFILRRRRYDKRYVYTNFSFKAFATASDFEPTWSFL